MASAGIQSPQHPQRNNGNSPGNLNPTKPTSCHRSLSAAADAAALLAVIVAFGFLLLPCLQLCCRGLAQAGSALLSGLRYEIPGAHTAFLLLALAFFLLTLVACGALLPGAGERKCGNPSGRRLQDTAELGVKIEAEECEKRWVCRDGGDGTRRLLLALSEERRGELEAELGRMLPPNCRELLLLRDWRGCTVWRLVVHGSTRRDRKAKS